jgi:hypothetical protein
MQAQQLFQAISNLHAASTPSLPPGASVQVSPQPDFSCSTKTKKKNHAVSTPSLPLGASVQVKITDPLHRILPLRLNRI